jgi:hypothetical protein
MVQFTGVKRRRAGSIAATRLSNRHLVWFSTGTFCLNAWKLLLSRMPQNLQQHHPCMAAAAVFCSLVCIRQIIPQDAIAAS